MRMPSESELSREQRELCSAPPEGTMLVVGPPGSGKTVVAIQRKEALARQGSRVEAVAWNNVLARYGGLDRTFESWLNSWWRGATGDRLPSYIENGSSRPDYHAALSAALIAKKSAIKRAGNWGNLILDEAQDFSTTAHKLLAAAILIVEEDAEEPPSLLILADENQRIAKKTNASINDIRQAHSLTEDDLYYLTKNYRNTREIASVARHFFIGTKSGIPELPDRRGDKPRILTSCTLDDAVAKIANHARTHEDHEIGVLVQFENTRKRIYNKLKYRLSETDIAVQTYHSNTKNGGGPQLARQLKFDGGGAITVLCFASAKGVEFDSVFLPELQQMPASDEDGEVSKMQLYVMTSRARTDLTLMLDDPEKKSPIWRLLPGHNELSELFDIA